MKSIVLLCIMFLWTGFFGFGCQQKTQAYSSAAIPITTEVGKQFVISLQSNATTGYKWQLAKPVDGAIIEFVSSQYVTPKTRLIGAGGEELWTFKAVGKGKAEIMLEYIRPWEKDKPPARQEVFTVLVD